MAIKDRETGLRKTSFVPIQAISLVGDYFMESGGEGSVGTIEEIFIF